MTENPPPLYSYTKPFIIGLGSDTDRELPPNFDLTEGTYEELCVPSGFEKGYFNGKPEPVFVKGFGQEPDIFYVQPFNEGKDIGMFRFGAFRCRRCKHIMYMPNKDSKGHLKPFECESDVCGRKGPFEPMFPADIIKPIWKLPDESYENVKKIHDTSGSELYKEVLLFCRQHLVLEEEQYHILTLWIMASWLVDIFDTVPYLMLIAPKESGKTQVLEVLNELAYRATLGISVTPAALFRAIEMWHITLLIDEAEYQVNSKTETGQALYGCLNGGYKRGAYALRVSGNTNDGMMPECYEVFGFKAVAATRVFLPTLESRSIVFNIRKGMPERVTIDRDTAGVLRAKLMFWRFESLGLHRLSLVHPEARSGRVIEIMTPLYTVAQVMRGLEGVKTIIKYNALVKILDSYTASLEADRKEEESGSTEAEVLTVLLDAIAEDQQKENDETGRVFLADMLVRLGWEADRSSRTTLGYKLKALGIKTSRRKNGVVINYNDNKNKKAIESLSKRYLSP